MKLRQYTLTSKYGSMTVWLEDDRAKVGDSVTLADHFDPGVFWKIEAAYSSIDAKDFHDGHDSGKVFGSIKGRSS